MAKALRILVIGDVKGRVDESMKKLSGIIRKTGNFDLTLCVGDFFGDSCPDWPSYKDGTKQAPVPIFVLGPIRSNQEGYFPDINGCELAKNITYLGKRGVYTGSSGLTIAYLSGLDGTLRNDKKRFLFSNDDVDFLHQTLSSKKDFKGVDVLLTSSWPRGADKYASPVPGGLDSEKMGSLAVNQVAIGLRPRYHFCGVEGVHYERQPYRNHKVLQGETKHATRFIALAKVNNPEKKKHMYAFNIIPMASMDPVELNKQPSDATECPYKFEPRPIRRPDVQGQQFFFANTANHGRGDAAKRGKRKPEENYSAVASKRPNTGEGGSCWFCLGSPEVEKHLVVSVGLHTYLALPKGGLDDDHVLICPIAHHQSMVSSPPEVVEEVEKYKQSLTRYFAKKGKVPVIYERNYKTSHLQVQVVPVLKEQASSTRAALEECGDKHNVIFAELPEFANLKEVVPVGVTYFHTELPSGEKFLYRIKKMFPLHFGREFLAHPYLLNEPQKVDWKQCQYSRSEEERLAKAFREEFRLFDFSI